jgi:membrane associated rhomboid family serine protease
LKCPNCGKELPDNSAFCSYCGDKLQDPEVEVIPPGNRCDFCARQVVYSDYFTCKYCGKKFCYDHRLPENHLCKSTSARRAVPTGSSYSSRGNYYSSSSGYSYQSRTSSFGINISTYGKNLIIAIITGFGVGSILSFFSLNGFPLIDFFLQYNLLVYQGWVVPLITSIFIVPLSLLGLTDVFFNAVAVFWLDRLLSATYNAKQYYAVFLATAVFGNIISLLNGPNVISFGASGGIFGLIAGAVSSNYAETRRVNPSLLIWFVIIFFLSSFGGPADILAHLGGALLGLAAGYIIGTKRKRVGFYY